MEEDMLRKSLKKKLGRSDFELALLPYFCSSERAVYRVGYPGGGYDLLEVEGDRITLVDPTTGEVLFQK